jgi:F420-non-reducing hydrogenase iron-sulfur subunit
LLGEIGLDGERVQMFNLSSAMGARFAEIAAEMTARVQVLGSNPLKETDVDRDGK